MCSLFVYLHFVDCHHGFLSTLRHSVGFVPANHRQLSLSILDQLCDWRWFHLLGKNVHSPCDKTQKLKLWKKKETQKLKWDKTQIVTNSNCNKTQIVTKLKLWHNSKLKIRQNSNCDKTEKLKLWHNLNYDKSKSMKKKTLKWSFSTYVLTPW